MFKKLAKQLKQQSMEISSFPASSPIKSANEENNKIFLKGLSVHALNLYERKTDINNFTKLALSNPENNSHNEIVDKLFGKEGFVDPFDDNKLFSLSENERFLKDLGL